MKSESDESAYKSGRVVVPDGLGVTEGLQEGIRVPDHVLDVLCTCAAPRHLHTRDR